MNGKPVGLMLFHIRNVFACTTCMLLFIFGGCQEEETLFTDKGRVEVGMLTRSGEAGAAVTWQEDAKLNACITYNGKTRTNVLIYKNNAWQWQNPASPLYWQSATSEQGLTIYSPIPPDANADNHFTLPDAWTSDNLSAYDLLSWHDSVKPATLPAQMELQHCMAQIKVTLQADEDLKIDLKGATVKMALPRNGAFSLTNGTVCRQQQQQRQTGESTFHRPDDDNAEYYALALPGQLDTRVITITTQAGVAFTYTAQSAIELAAGTCHTYTLKLQKKEVEAIGVEVSDWTSVSDGQIGENKDRLVFNAFTGNLSYVLEAISGDTPKEIWIQNEMDTTDVSALNKFIKEKQITTLKLYGNYSLPKEAFKECSTLETIYLPDMTYITEYAFQSTGIKKLTDENLPKATVLGKGCFQSCGSLTEVELNNVTQVGEDCFWISSGSRGAAMTKVSFPNITSLPKTFMQNRKLQSGVLLNFPKVATMGDGAMSGFYMEGSSPYYGKVILAVTTFPDFLKYSNTASCYPVKEVILNNVKEVPESAFLDNKVLEKISMPSVTKIGSYAFKNCSNLDFYQYRTSMDSLELGKGAFYSTGLTEFHYSGTGTLAENLCEECDSLSVVDIRNISTEINHRVFYGATVSQCIIATGDLYKFGDMAFACGTIPNFVWGVASGHKDSDFSWGNVETSFSGTTITNLFLTRITDSKEAAGLRTKLLATGDGAANATAVTNVYYGYNGPNSNDPAKATNAELTNASNYTKLEIPEEQP